MVVVLLTPVTFRLIGEAYRGIYPALADAPLALALKSGNFGSVDFFAKALAATDAG